MEKNLQKQIDGIRQDIPISTEYTNCNNLTNIKRKLKKLMRSKKSSKNS